LPVSSTRAWRWYGGRRASPPALPEARSGSIVVSGAALGLPGQNHHVFDDGNVDRILRGDSFIDPVPHVFRARMVEKNVVRLVKREVGEPSLDPIKSVDEVIRLAGRRGIFRYRRGIRGSARARGSLGHHHRAGHRRGHRSPARRRHSAGAPLSSHHHGQLPARPLAASGRPWPTRPA
jgi:hypothetical protein